jgi:hypothetical protein
VAFVTDGMQWSFNGWHPEEIRDAIDTLLERVRVAYERDEKVWIGDDFQTRHVLGGLDLWSLFSPVAPLALPAELGQELAAWLGRAPLYADEPNWPEGIGESLISVNCAEAVENNDLAWVHHSIRAGRPMACLSLRERGKCETISSQGRASVHWVNSENEHRTFWRDAIDIEGDNEAVLERFSPHAFPDLYFYNNVWRGLSRLAGGYSAIRTQLRRYLSTLDDYGAWAFTFPPPALSPDEAVTAESDVQPSSQIIERRFHGLNLDMAPENSNVYADGQCRRAREVTLGNRTLYCEWHGKLERHRNRIHVHKPVPEADEKVVIAFFHEHLPLP